MVRVCRSRVGIIGGSIAGCATAIALGRLGCDVHVFERSAGTLRDRGAGVMLPPALRDELIGEGYLPGNFPTCPFKCRLWIVADGTAGGRRLWSQPGMATATNWGVLWRALRASIPNTHYHDDMSLVAVATDHAGAMARFADGSAATFDVLFGADGYRSLIRTHISSSSQPDYAGYVAWRGTYPEERLRQRAAIDLSDTENAWFLVGFDGGHAIVYVVPSFESRVDAGHRRVNWLVYTATPQGMDFASPTSIPPGGVTPELARSLEQLLADAFPPDFQALIGSTPREELAIQPIYDQCLGSYISGSLAVVGDAGAVCRPHTASGTAKAMQDAYALERLGRDYQDWEDLLAAYDAERSTAGASLVELGRRIGRDQVEQTPSWASLVSGEMPAWTSTTLAGTSLYFYGSADPRA